MRLTIINSIIGPKEKFKIENKIKNLLDPNDFSNWFVVNDVDKDYILSRISYKKISEFESFLREVGVLIDSVDLNLDIVLDKINNSGVDSLHEYERVYLDEYK